MGKEKPNSSAAEHADASLTTLRGVAFALLEWRLRSDTRPEARSHFDGLTTAVDDCTAALSHPTLRPTFSGAETLIKSYAYAILSEPDRDLRRDLEDTIELANLVQLDLAEPRRYPRWRIKDFERSLAPWSTRLLAGPPVTLHESASTIVQRLTELRHTFERLAWDAGCAELKDAIDAANAFIVALPTEKQIREVAYFESGAFPDAFDKMTQLLSEIARVRPRLLAALDVSPEQDSSVGPLQNAILWSKAGIGVCEDGRVFVFQQCPVVGKSVAITSAIATFPKERKLGEMLELFARSESGFAIRRGDLVTKLGLVKGIRARIRGTQRDDDLTSTDAIVSRALRTEVAGISRALRDRLKKRNIGVPNEGPFRCEGPEIRSEIRVAFVVGDVDESWTFRQQG